MPAHRCRQEYSKARSAARWQPYYCTHRRSHQRRVRKVLTRGSGYPGYPEPLRAKSLPYPDPDSNIALPGSKSMYSIRLRGNPG